MSVIADEEGAGPISWCLDCGRRTLQMFLSSADSFVLNQWVLHILVREKNALHLRSGSEENRRRIVFVCVKVVSHFCNQSSPKYPYQICNIPSSFLPLVAGFLLL